MANMFHILVQSIMMFIIFPPLLITFGIFYEKILVDEPHYSKLDYLIYFMLTLIAWNILLPQCYFLLATASQGDNFDKGISLVTEKITPIKDYLLLLLVIKGLSVILPKYRNRLIHFGFIFSMSSFLLTLITLFSLWILSGKNSHSLYGETYRHTQIGHYFEVLWGERVYAEIINIRGYIGDARRSLATPSFSTSSIFLCFVAYYINFFALLPFFESNHNSIKKAA